MEQRREAARVTKAAEANGMACNTAPETTPPRLQLLQRVAGEYREMPGLNLTVSQAERLFGLDSSTCASILTTLLERGVLRQATNGRYLRGPFA